LFSVLSRRNNGDVILVHTIKNDVLEISVKEIGAELCSIKSLSSEKEYIWDGNPEVWESHAPNLFPIIGCLKDDGFLYKGKKYNCPKHGFVRKNKNVSLIHENHTSLTFGLEYSEETLRVYPFKFYFFIKFILKENSVIFEHTVVNNGDEKMWFSLGGHPAFKCPINIDENYSDYFLEFENPETAETWRVEKNGLIGKETTPVFDEPTIINLHPRLFEEDALVFKNLNSSKVSLKSIKSNQVLSVNFNDFPNLGIWAKPNADFVCIEPWLGIADSIDSDRNFENKEGLAVLEAGKSFTATYSIFIDE